MTLGFAERPLRFLRHELNIQRAYRELRLKMPAIPFQVCVENTLRTLSSHNLPVVQDELDDEEVRQFAQRAEYEFYYPNYYPNRELVRLKKIREHYMAARLLELSRSDVYLDIASQHSPAPQVYERIFGCKVLRQDFEYPQGRHGRVLGGSAGNMDLIDNSVTKAAMHCSLEHFEGDEDIVLFKEMERVLVPGGKFVVVPLYLSDEYFIFTQPSLYADLPQSSWPNFDHDAILYRASGGNRHERYYDVKHLMDRILSSTGLQVVVHSFGNFPAYQLGQMRFAAVFTKK